MAHGNLSDLVFFALLGVVIQWWAFPDTLYQDVGPFKAQFSSRGDDMALALKVGGGVALMVAMIFSGVSWNPINGKMAGLGGFIAVGTSCYTQCKADSDLFIPKFVYVYAFILFLGILHIFAFPSNPLPEKSPETKNNHGNWSDKIAVPMLGFAAACFLYPDHLFQDVGPIKAQFTTRNADLAAMIKIIGGLLLILSLMLSGVKWNPINGKMGGLGGFIGAGYTAYSLFKADKDIFVPRMFYIYAFLVFVASVHIFAFPANPVLKKPAAKND